MSMVEKNLIASNATLIGAISKKCKEIRKRELHKAAKKMAAKSGTEDYIRIEQLTLVLVDALLKIPITEPEDGITNL